jgi:hypothetical protein
MSAQYKTPLQISAVLDFCNFGGHYIREALFSFGRPFSMQVSCLSADYAVNASETPQYFCVHEVQTVQ